VSRSIDLFIQSPGPIEDVASQMASLAELELKPGELPGTWALDAGQVHAELRAHPYVDDGDLVLERYQYALSARVANTTRLADSAEAALLRLVSDSLRRAGMACLLVHDLQYRDHGPSAGQESPVPQAGDS
jgi:hypothetical protein